MRKALAAILPVLAVALLAAHVDAAEQTSSGAALYRHECVPCHAPGANASRMLAKRLGKENALLTERNDLDPDYIRTVVRRGINSMMPLSRVQVTDDQLDAIVRFLTR
jgi:mono/diheme cytochrome c family protein